MTGWGVVCAYEPFFNVDAGHELDRKTHQPEKTHICSFFLIPFLLKKKRKPKIDLVFIMLVQSTAKTAESA
jgi:hypothetical protein